MYSSRFPYVSIIIPTYNEAKFIRFCLSSLKNLNYPHERFEIIIVDNGSTDETVSICKEFTSKIFIAPNLTIAGLRNYGASKALGEIYAFIDADCVADKDWLLNAVTLIKKRRCITGSKYLVPQNSTWLEKAWFSQRPKGRIEVPYINSGNLLVPEFIFKKVGGFKESLKTGEDYEFCVRASKEVKIISDENIKVTHLGNPKTIRQFIKREIWHGIGALGSLKIKPFDKPLLGTIAFFILTIFQIVGIFLDEQRFLFVYSTLLIVLLLTITVIWRIKYASSFLLVFQLFLLYYFYYLGRSISLLYIITDQTFYRKCRFILQL